MPGLAEKGLSLQRVWEATLDDAVVAVGWSADRRWLAAASATGVVTVYGAAEGHEVQRWKAHEVGATTLAWHPWDDLLMTAGQDGRAKLWRVDRDEPVATLACGSAWVEHVAWAPSGKVLATAAGRVLKLWKKEGEEIRTFEKQPNTIAGLAWSADSQRLVSACYGFVVFWSPESSEPRRKLEWKGSMVALAWSPDGRYLCHGNQDATVHFWVVATGKELQMTGYPNKVAQLSWDKGSRYLATGGSPQITVWDCSGKGPRGSTPLTLEHHLSPLRVLQFQPEGPLLASGDARGDVAVWWPGKSKTPLSVSTLRSTITALAWSKERLAVAAESGKLVVYGT